MLAVTNPTAWDLAVRNSHVVTLRCELWSGGAKLLDLYPDSGSVTVDARRAVRRSVTITLADYDGTLTPTASNLTLAPYGNELRLFRGINYGDGTSDEVPLGVFRITETSVSYGDEAVSLSITGEDRARVIQARPFSTAYVVAASVNFADVLTGIVSDRLPGVEMNVTPTTYATPGSRPLGFGPDSDPWADVQTIAQSLGHEAYFDAYGAFTTSPIPSLDSSTPVASFADDSVGVTISIDRTLSSDAISNGVTFTAEGSHLLLPLVSTVWDDDSTSPFRRTGPLGERPADVSSSWIVSQAQCDDAAAAEYQAVRGQTVTLSIVPNPRLDVRDVISITSSELGIDSTAIVDTLTIPFDIGSPMQITARTKGY